MLGWMLVLITALFGGITAGLGGWVGASIRRTLIAFRKRGGSEAAEVQS